MKYRCEVQFDYGLQQYRQLPVAQRPAAFVTPAGNRIKVERKIVVKNDKVLKAGTVRISALIIPYSC